MKILFQQMVERHGITGIIAIMLIETACFVGWLKKSARLSLSENRQRKDQ